MRVTKKKLREMVDKLNAKEGRPITGYTRDEKGHLHNNVGHICLDPQPQYGGYRLDVLCEHGTDFYWPRWERVSAREMYTFLEGKLHEPFPPFVK